MAFDGKLIQLKINGTWTEFPTRYVNAESYKITPNQRMESSANRAASGMLVRKTVSHTATKIDFSTTILTNSDVNAINTMLSSAYTDSLQRKLNVRYYNPATDATEDGVFYVPDVDYEIMRIDRDTNTIWYNSIRFAFIEY